MGGSAKYREAKNGVTQLSMYSDDEKVSMDAYNEKTGRTASVSMSRAEYDRDPEAAIKKLRKRAREKGVYMPRNVKQRDFSKVTQTGTANGQSIYSTD